MVRPEGVATDCPSQRHHRSGLTLRLPSRTITPCGPSGCSRARLVPIRERAHPKAPPPPPTQHELEQDLWLIVSNRFVDKSTALVALKNVTTALRLDMKIDTMSSGPDVKGKIRT